MPLRYLECHFAGFFLVCGGEAREMEHAGWDAK